MHCMKKKLCMSLCSSDCHEYSPKTCLLLHNEEKKTIQKSIDGKINYDLFWCVNNKGIY
jgi:hypothetical protein